MRFRAGCSYGELPRQRGEISPASYWWGSGWDAGHGNYLDCRGSRPANDLSGNVSALALQAGTGLLAIVVLLVVMNWFFHKMYWRWLDFPT